MAHSQAHQHTVPCRERRRHEPAWRYAPRHHPARSCASPPPDACGTERRSPQSCSKKTGDTTHMTTITRLRRSSFVAHAPLPPNKNKSGTSTTQRPCPRAMDIAVPPRGPSVTPTHGAHHTPGDGGWSSSLRCQKSERSAPGEVGDPRQHDSESKCWDFSRDSRLPSGASLCL